MNNINDQIQGLKNDVILLVQSLDESNKNEIDQHKLTELASNMKALLEYLEKHYDITLK